MSLPARRLVETAGLLRFRGVGCAVGEVEVAEGGVLLGTGGGGQQREGLLCTAVSRNRVVEGAGG